MHAEHIWAHWKKQPFQPIRIHLTNGGFYDIPRRDLMLVSQTEVVIGLNWESDGIPESSALLSTMQVSRIEPIDGNGRKKRPRNPS